MPQLVFLAHIILKDISVFYNKAKISKENVKIAENVIRNFASCMKFTDFNYGSYGFDNKNNVLSVKLSGEPNTVVKDISAFLQSKEIAKSDRVVFDIKQSFRAPKNVLKEDKTVVFGKEVFENLSLFNFYFSNKQCLLKSFKYNIKTKLELSPKYQNGYIVDMHYVIECKKKEK